MAGTIFSDYETWADVYCFHGILYCVYTETVDQGDHSETSIVVSSSTDEGKTWQEEKLPYQKKGVPFWCRPRFLKGKTNRLIVFCNLVESIEQPGEIFLLEYKDHQWLPPVSTDIYGFLSGNPIVLESGKTILPVHTINSVTMYYQQQIYQTYDMEKWKHSTFSKAGYDLGGAQIVEHDHNIIALIRERSVSGWDLFMIRSEDNANQWSPLKKIAFKGGCSFSAAVSGDRIYLAFARDKYLDYRKTLSMVSADINQLFKNHNMIQFYALTENGGYKVFADNNIGYTGVDIVKDDLFAVEVRSNKRTTVIEITKRKMKKLQESMVEYQITSFQDGKI